MPPDFAALIDAMPNPVILHDVHDRLIYWNESARELYGWDMDALKGRLLTHLLYSDPEKRRELEASLKTEGRWHGELRQFSKDGSEHLIDSRIRIFGDVGDGLVLCSNVDVTAERKVSDAARRAHHVKSSTILAGGIAHELNNALAPIMLSAAMIKRGLEDEKQRNMLGMIEKCSSRASELISDLLAYERGKGGGADTIRMTQFKRLFDRLCKEQVASGIRQQVVIAEDLWEATGKLEELQAAFRAIIQNACEAMVDSGELRIEVQNHMVDENFEGMAPEAKAGSYVGIHISDTGHGIESGLLERVAEPFFTTKAPKAGHGFGLANAQAIIKGHDGFMVIESEAGRGTSMHVYFPAQAPVGEAVESGSAGQTEGGGQVVLVADDEFFVREAIRRSLEARGYHVLSAEDGTEALALYAQRGTEIEIVVTNVEMPFMDGPALCRALMKLNPDVRILVSSGHKKQDKINELKAAGVTYFLSKPYTAENLADTVSRVLQEGQ